MVHQFSLFSEAAFASKPTPRSTVAQVAAAAAGMGAHSIKVGRAVDVAQIRNAAANHGIPAQVLVDKLPANLENYGPEAVAKCTQEWHVSHKQPVSDFPNLKSKHGNVYWEDGRVNQQRGNKVAGLKVVQKARGQNRLGAVKAVLTSSSGLGKLAFNLGSAAAGAAAFSAVDATLQEHKVLRNGTEDQRKQARQRIRKEAGKGALQSLVPSAAMFVGSILAPGAAAALAAPAVVGVGAVLAVGKLIHSAATAQAPSNTPNEVLAEKPIRGTVTIKMPHQLELRLAGHTVEVPGLHFQTV